MWKVIGFLSWTIVILAIGITIGKFFIKSPENFRSNTEVRNDQSPSSSQTEDQKYLINIPAIYFDTNSFEYDGLTYLNDVYYTDPPESIRLDQPKKIVDEEIPKYQCDPTGIGFCPKKKYLDTMDVDMDGKKEQVLEIDQGINHGVRDLFIIKNNRVVFKIEEAPSSISPTKSNNGFYLTIGSGNILGMPSTSTIVRYIYKEGVYLPVWSQTSHQLASDK